MKAPQIWGGNGSPYSRSSKGPKYYACKEDKTTTHYNQTVKSQRQREYFERSQRKNINHMQGKLYMTVSAFLIRSSVGRKGRGVACKGLE